MVAQQYNTIQHINHARSYIQQQQNPTQQHNAPPGDKIRTISVLVRRSLLTRPCVMRDFFLGCRRSFFFSFSLVLPRIELALLGMSLTTLGVTQTSSPPLESTRSSCENFGIAQFSIAYSETDTWYGWSKRVLWSAFFFFFFFKKIKKGAVHSPKFSQLGQSGSGNFWVTLRE